MNAPLAITVGVVLESPADNRLPYLVRFADGETVQAYFHELALRRREVEDELGEVTDDLQPWIIYRCQVGSKAFGLASEDSDDDLRGIYLPAARLHWSLRRLPEQLEFKAEEKDEVYWELERSLRLSGRVLEVLLSEMGKSDICPRTWHPCSVTDPLVQERGVFWRARCPNANGAQRVGHPPTADSGPQPAPAVRWTHSGKVVTF